MATEKRVTFNDHGEPQVVITITGWDDAFRFAWAMGHLQCDFADVARRVGGSLRRRIGAAEFRRMHEHFTGDDRIGWARHDPADDEPAEAR